MNNRQLCFLTLLVSLIPTIAVAQDVDSLKSGVVRIKNTYTEEVGTGFIIKVDNERAYVMTASHVVKGNQHPNIYLYNRPTEAVEGTQHIGKTMIRKDWLCSNSKLSEKILLAYYL